MANAETPIQKRIQSIDILRGAIMLLMALDHVRGDFHISKLNPTDLYSTTPVVFLTRWITHFCAPGFLLLSGISAYLAGMKKSKSDLSLFLIKRGFWLIVVEVVVITFAHKLDIFYREIFLQVIWAIGVSMIILGLLIWAPLPVIGIVGAVLFFGHDIFDYLNIPRNGFSGVLLNALFGKPFSLNINARHFISFFYAVLPCTAIMLLGYSAGPLYNQLYEQAKRRRILIISGAALICLFLVLRTLNGYGDPFPWATQKSGIYTFLSYLDVTKYPLSLDYMCMTLGPMLIALALMENLNNWVTSRLTTFGRVAFFYYIIHLYLIRLLQIAAFFIWGTRSGGIIANGAPHAISVRFHIVQVYLIWAFVILVMYFPCKWFANYKQTHRQWWLSYL